MKLFKLGFTLILVFTLTHCASPKKTSDTKKYANEQAKILYERGKKALDRGNYTIALRFYRALEANYPYGEFTEQSKLESIYALNKLDKADAAVEQADSFIQLYPTHPNVDYAYYMRGVANFEKKKGRLVRFLSKGKTIIRDPQPYRDSEIAFTELIQRYPESTYTKDATKRVAYIRDVLADRELGVAEYYFKRKAYVAALNRCKNIIYKYETSKAIEPTLVLMRKTYLKMGLTDLAQNTQQILKTNFPNSVSLSEKKEKKGFLRRLNPFK